MAERMTLSASCLARRQGAGLGPHPHLGSERRFDQGLDLEGDAPDVVVDFSNQGELLQAQRDGGAAVERLAAYHAVRMSQRRFRAVEGVCRRGGRP